MTNNKQQGAVDWLFDKMYDPTYPAGEQINWLGHAKEMEIAGKEMSYSDGYKEGYHRAIENAKYQINKWIDKELKITQQ
jgi:hypothetical protein